MSDKKPMFEGLEDTIFDTEKTIEEVDYKKFIINPSDINSDIEKYHSGKIKKGYGTGIDELDKYIVAKENEFYAVVGKKGDGKTTILQIQFLMWAIANDLIWVVAFKENVDWAVKIALLNLLLGQDEKQVKEENPELYLKASNWIDKHFIFIAVDSMREGTEVCKGLINDGIKAHALVLDPANSFYSGWADTGNEFADGKKTAIELLKFTLSTCSLYLSQHPTMAGQRQDGDVNSKQAEGGWFFNKASFTCNYNRTRGTNITRLAVENVRNKFTGGKETHPEYPVLLYWNKYKIDIECDGNIEYNVVQKLRRKFNPLNENFKEAEVTESIVPEGFVKYDEIPMGNITDAFGEPEEDNGIAF